MQRVNAASVLQGIQDPRLIGPLLTLLKDEAPQVRYYAVMATAGNWDSRFVGPLIALFRDPILKSAGRRPSGSASRINKPRPSLCNVASRP